MDQDDLIRAAAFARIRWLAATNDHLSASDLAAGFDFQGQRIPLINPRRGIFKPKQMRYLLSIKTVFPKPGAKIWYDDQRTIHKQIFDSRETIDYAFMGEDPTAADNTWLKEAFEKQIPIIYFIGIAPGTYSAVAPSFVVGWDPNLLRSQIAFGVSDGLGVGRKEPPERRYALRMVQQRLHQATFREAVMSAYSGRCALSGLPELLLLDAAHIINDRDEDLGHPIVTNGIPLSKIHHAAFDAHLIGIDPDYRIHIADRLMTQVDGQMLESMKSLDGGKIHLPRREKDWPDRDRLDIRYRQFKDAA